MYPLMLSLAARQCLVVGGGAVALRKVEGLLLEGALVTIVALDPLESLIKLADDGAVSLQRRKYQKGEAEGYWLVFAATDDRQVNQQISHDCEAARVWVNVVDDVKFTTVHLPSRVRRGSLQIAVSSAGEAPFVTRRMRQLLERRFGNEWKEWLESAGYFRQAVRAACLSRSDEEVCFDRFFANTVDSEKLTARIPTPDEIASWIATEKEGNTPKNISENIDDFRSDQTDVSPGLVSLVGAGPGDSGLLTLKGRRRLLSADAVVYDRLAETSLPCDLPLHVDLHYVGKISGRHAIKQPEITSLMVRLAKQGKRVVRLKGGDPFVFGRGGEEALRLEKEGIPFEIVPGVTSGVAVPAYAGIPVTSRKEAVKVTLLTAHECLKEEGTQLRWDLLAKDEHCTIVGYMGMAKLSSVVQRLIAFGKDPKTPSAVIHRGTLPSQRVVSAPLERLPEAVKEAKLKPPGLFVIGTTVAYHERLNWFSNRPLSGRRVVMIAPAPVFGEVLELLGAEIIEVPLTITPASRVVMGALPITDCVVRNKDEVDGFDDERSSQGWSSEVTFWCVGERSADRARMRGWQKIIELSSAVTPEQLAGKMAEL